MFVSDPQIKIANIKHGAKDALPAIRIDVKTRNKFNHSDAFDSSVQVLFIFKAFDVFPRLKKHHNAANNMKHPGINIILKWPGTKMVALRGWDASPTLHKGHTFASSRCDFFCSALDTGHDNVKDGQGQFKIF